MYVRHQTTEDSRSTANNRQEQEAQLLPTGRVMLCFTEYFAKSLKVIGNDILK